MAGNPKIIVLSEQLRGQSFELTASEYTIGRSEECGICIPDPTVSNHHCTLIQRSDGEGYYARDEGSTNGTRVNGVRISEQDLENSDILQVGAIEMLYDSEDRRTATSVSTQTGINLHSTAGTSTMSEIPNFSPFGSSAAGLSQNRKTTYVIGAVIGLLIIAVLVVLGLLILKLVTV
jgi:pSer/pThr/pTyr-binding forkhead associated (FHA) protein